MTDKTRLGLLPTTQPITVAASDDGLGGRSATRAGAPDRDELGWDPFEVWRTRVKEARARSIQSPGGRPQN
jgi:hypothetical protein